MKSALILAAMVLLVSAPLGIVNAQEVYWESGETGDIDLSDERELDLKLPDTKAKSFGDMEIYDTPRTEEPDDLEAPEEAPEEPVVRPQAPQRPPADRPATQDTSRPTRLRQPGTPATTQSADTERKSTLKRPEKKRGTPVPPAVEQSDKPAAGTQLPPGQVEVKPAEPRSKLQWGKDEK